MDVREGWLRLRFPSLRLLPTPVDAPPDAAPDAVHQAFCREQLAALGIDVDAVFTSETYGEGLADALGAKHVLVDAPRLRHPVSGTALRRDPHAHRDAMAPEVYAHFVRRVVVVGAESTGKTTLAQALADHYGTAWVEEYGRFVFAREHGRLSTMHLLEIAHGHLALEDTALREGRATRFLVSDTHPLTTLWWSYQLTGTAEPALVALADTCAKRYAVTFLCDDAMPFEQDGWRSSENVRRVFQQFVRYDLDRRGIPYVLLTGTPEERLAKAAAHLDALLAADDWDARLLG